MATAAPKQKNQHQRAYGLLIKTDLTYEPLTHKDFGKAVGSNIELLDGRRCKRFVAYADENGLHNNVGMNDLAAEVLDILGFNISTFIAGVRGNIVIVHITDEKQILGCEMAELVQLCEDVLKNDDNDETKSAEIKQKYKHLRSSRLKKKNQKKKEEKEEKQTEKKTTKRKRPLVTSVIANNPSAPSSPKETEKTKEETEAKGRPQ